MSALIEFERAGGSEAAVSRPWRLFLIVGPDSGSGTGAYPGSEQPLVSFTCGQGQLRPSGLLRFDWSHWRHIVDINKVVTVG